MADEEQRGIIRAEVDFNGRVQFFIERENGDRQYIQLQAFLEGISMGTVYATEMPAIEPLEKSEQAGGAGA